MSRSSRPGSGSGPVAKTGSTAIRTAIRLKKIQPLPYHPSRQRVVHKLCTTVGRQPSHPEIVGNNDKYSTVLVPGRSHHPHPVHNPGHRSNRQPGRSSTICTAPITDTGISSLNSFQKNAPGENTQPDPRRLIHTGLVTRAD